MCRQLLIVILASALVMAPSVLQAESSLSGKITAERDDGSGYGAWKYTLHVIWDTGTEYGLSHLDLIVDDGSGRCGCEAFRDAITWDGPPGYLMDQEGECQMGLDPELKCDGDTSIGVWSPLFKFEPNEGPDCHADPVGEITVVFYSDIAPGAISRPNSLLADRYAQYTDFGMVTGSFPAMPCDPVSAETLPWDRLKAVYR